VGRRNYGGDDDADVGLGRALWCAVRHLRPQHVVETGVAHGVSSRCILEALERNQDGHLWSIDLPPLTIPERRSEIAVAVPENRRERWTYIEGSSRRKLPALLRELGELQLFFHDSWHSTRNTEWELKQAWSALTSGGVVIADDIDGDWGFSGFERSVADGVGIHCVADDGQRLFGAARKAVS
jgi:predicted O-methyltransferase YrrM